MGCCPGSGLVRLCGLFLHFSVCRQESMSKASTQSEYCDMFVDSEEYLARELNDVRALTES
jgi:hypothetical protein